ncbi:MAG TPA: MFS transporter [Burkholderiaceae bacterium]|nr:MFS transporter [Burkholderiaceae bacterium]
MNRGSADGRRAVFAVIAAATVQNLPFGTIYAFSVFLKPMEALLGVSRTQMTLVFSIASVCLTAGMVLGPTLYRRGSPVGLLAWGGAFSAAGLWLAAGAQGYLQLLLGYGVMFGLGGGLAFVIVQQGVNQTLTRASGLVNGYIVSLYPLGAMIGAPLFGWAIAAFGLRATLAALGVVILIAGVVTAGLFRSAGVRMHDASPAAAAEGDRRWSVFARLFIVFFLAAAAGLTVMSQAAGIMAAYGAQTVFALGATTFITGAIAAARIAGGALVDRLAIPHVACGAHLIAGVGSLLLLVRPSAWIAVPGLSMIGIGYGLMSGVTAGAIGRYWHRNLFGRVAGLLYIAWCGAAISLPVLAGWLFDRTQNYGGAMLIAAAVNTLGALLAVTLPRRAPPAAAAV